MARDAERAPVDPVERLFELTPDMLGTASPDGFFTRLNPAWTDTFGWTTEELLSKPYIWFIHPDDVPATLAAAQESFTSARADTGFENRYRTADGDYRWLEWTTITADDIVYFAAKDITARKAADLDRDQNARMTQAIVESVADGLYVADSNGELTFINPAGLKLLGYDSSDELIGRSPHDAFHHADAQHHSIGDCPLASVRHTGLAAHVEEDGFWCKDGSALAVSYSSAPIELSDGRGSVVAFRDISDHKARELLVHRELEALSWVGRIRDALAEHRFVLYAQPIVDIATGDVALHEVLVRMLAPSGEAIAPAEFLPVAEEHGLIRDIDRRVMELAIPLASRGHKIALNLSADSISQPGMFKFVEHLIASNNVDPELLVFEITETALIHDEHVAQVFVENIRKLNCAVALDDFGSGYGSFRYLKNLPVSLLKVDQEFVRDLDGAASQINSHVIQAVVTLAEGMGQKVVAEGVETESALAILRTLGVDYAQGYYFARPAPADDVFNQTGIGTVAA